MVVFWLLVLVSLAVLIFLGISCANCMVDYAASGMSEAS